MYICNLLTNHFVRLVFVFILCFLCVSIILFSKNLFIGHQDSRIILPKTHQDVTSLKRIQPNIIIPIFLRFNHVEILDFILYPHFDQKNQFSIFLSGRRKSWPWSDIFCLFGDSKIPVHGVIDRRSEEPFITCPVPPLQQQLILNGSSQLLISLLINDTHLQNSPLLSPNVTVPIYHRDQYNISIYTMIRNKAEELIEWIEYHLLIGIEHFYLYDHFSNDNLEFFLRSYLKRKLVTIVRWSYAPLPGHRWNSVQRASMNHALKNFGPFNRWLGYFDVDEYFQIFDFKQFLKKNISLVDFLDRNFPELTYPGGVQFQNCPISCYLNQIDLIASRYRVNFEKCRHISRQRKCLQRTKMFIRPRHVPLMKNIHALEHGLIYAKSSISASLAQFRHYHYGVMITHLSNNETVDTSMDIFIHELKKRVVTYS